LTPQKCNYFIASMLAVSKVRMTPQACNYFIASILPPVPPCQANFLYGLAKFFFRKMKKLTVPKMHMTPQKCIYFIPSILAVPKMHMTPQACNYCITSILPPVSTVPGKFFAWSGIVFLS
jgi:hypothetical protein